jgi:hypothetical protein
MLSWTILRPSSQSTTPFLSVTLTSPTAKPLSLACLIYSALLASRKCHARKTASRGKKSCGSAAGSVEVDPGFLSRVAVDFGRVTDGDRTMCDADARDEVGAPLEVYVIVVFVLMDSRSAKRASGLAMFAMRWVNNTGSAKLNSKSSLREHQRKETILAFNRTHCHSITSNNSIFKTPTPDALT